MRATAGLATLAAGAILTFAVSAQVPGINLRLTGLIVMVTGLIALITPSRAAAWLQGRMPGHGAAAEPAADDPADVAYPAYLLQDPAVLAAEVLNSARASRPGPAPSRPAPRPSRPGPTRIPRPRPPEGMEQDSQDWGA
jgi:hypothetical protein